MHRLTIQLVSALGTLIALAIFDLGPQSHGAYQTVSSGMAVGVGLAEADSADYTDHSFERKHEVEPDALQQRVPSGSTTSLPTTGHGGDGPPVGLPHLAETPSPGLVAYFRDPPGSLDTSHFVASILDPPRPV